MNIQRQMKNLKNVLPLALESRHFILHFGFRNPLDGAGMGVHGVRNKMIVVSYLEALETLYSSLSMTPWQREPPVTDSSNKTHVYILDSSPFTYHDRNEVPFLVLSCRSNEPTTQAELHRAAAEAVHEGTHLFNYTKRPMHDPNSNAWVWFDEGLAMLMEMLVAPGNPDYFRFLMNWIDMPEMPLDDPDGQYQAGMFIRYLAKKMGPEFVNSVWLESKLDEAPLETLERLMPAGQKFLSANPDDQDLFASGYCIDPYFIWDHGHPCAAPDVFLRYGERAISESRAFKARDQTSIVGLLDHLACRYYRFFLKSDARSLDIVLEPKVSAQGTPFKAEVAVVTKERERLASSFLRPSGNGDSSPQLSTRLIDLDPDAVDHVVLVVSNCGVRSYAQSNGINHDDNKEYTIRVSAS